MTTYTLLQQFDHLSSVSIPECAALVRGLRNLRTMRLQLRWVALRSLAPREGLHDRLRHFVEPAARRDDWGRLP
jgi:hypothetical protein